MNENLKRYLLMTIGAILSSGGVYCFAVAAGVPVTGVAGITSILFRMYDLPMGWINIALNIPIILICGKSLGKKYLLRSAYCMAIYALFTDYVFTYIPTYNGERILATICGGLIMSIGDAIIYMNNSSTGGMDFISVYVKVKKPHLKIGTINLIQSILIFTINCAVFKDIDSIIYGLIMSYISSEVVNRMIMGFNKTTLMMIVTDSGKKICDTIVDEIDRGSTILHGKGGYKEDKKEVVLCACSPKELYSAEQRIKQIDPKCFIILLESSEIHGEGFNIVKYGTADEE